MKNTFNFWFIFLILFLSPLKSEIIETFYGEIEVQEPVLIELIHSSPFQRLTHLRQYGEKYYTDKVFSEDYTRYDHSLGVFALLRLKNASLEEQISGLLHDVSHTVFSHVGDWVFNKPHCEEDYQTTIFNDYLIKSGIEKTLNRYGYTIEQISPKRKEFQMLEQPLPDLCADRIDYNIQGAYFQKFLSYEETQKLFSGLLFRSGKWIIIDPDLALKLTRFSMFMTESCWGGPTSWMSSQWLGDAIIRGLEIGLISEYQFHFGIDQEVWEELSQSQDICIQDKMRRIQFPDRYFQVVDPLEAQKFLKFRCRVINPLILYQGEIIRLMSLYPELDKAFQTMKTRSDLGWPVKFLVSENRLEQK